MARKSNTQTQSHHGFNDVVGIVLLGAAALLLVALFSYDWHDIASNAVSSQKQPVQNAIGPLGAHLAYAAFFVFGVSGYLLPFVLLFLGLGCFFEMFAYLRRRWLWTIVMMVSLMGLFHQMDGWSLMSRLRVNLNAPSAGGLIGRALYDYGFWMVGPVGAPIIYLLLYFISLLFLTNFQLGAWVRRLVTARGEAVAASPEEAVLEKRARELRKQEEQLKKAVEQSGVAVGADLQPVPPPQVRDLSVPQKGPRFRKSVAPDEARKPEPAEPDEPAEEVVVVVPPKKGAATAKDILGDAAEVPAKPTGAADADAASEPATANELAAEQEAPKPPAPVVTDSTVPKPRPQPKKKRPMTVASVPMIGNYTLPPLDFLQHADLSLKPTESKEELLANANLMKQTLGQFNIPVEVGNITKGPTITRYELHPAPGVKLDKINGFSSNIAAALKAERIHILAPIPGKNTVGIEVPNPVKTKVIMRDLLESDEWRLTKAKIPVALGKDVYGHPIIADLAEMPHLLIAGSTGSGKSVCINSIIASLLYRFSPDQLRFVMIDPKVVELQHYNTLPHLVVPVVTDPKKVILALRWVVNEMEKRYKIFARVGVRNIASFNSRPKNKPLPEQELELPLTQKKEKVEAGAEGFAVEVDEEIVVPREEDIVIPERLSYIVCIIDELADLMLVAPADVEMAIARITQMARAAGIHCIVATQRPSVDVITGVIKANIPARIAFQVASRVDSRTILDAMGADKLLGKGDMLYLPPGSAKLIRAQGALITDQELQSVVDFIARQGKPSFDQEIHQQLQKPVSSFEVEEGASNEDEDLIQQCIEVIRSEQKASVSLLQRRLRLGYTRAARIMDELEQRGIVGPSKGAEPRDILLDLDGTGLDGKASAGDQGLAPG
ncbi:MAG TPA: DNA translocase FtsK [Verrucomicrobiae bacterium]|nr:DNA translocase FtsK [Verrucomicrobiae bacterium]